MTRPRPFVTAWVTALALGCATCGNPAPEETITLLIAGQSLIKVDPRQIWPNAFSGVRPFIEAADIAFTNFEMAVASADTRCGLPADYETITGEPPIPPENRPGNTGGPHAVSPDVMEFLASLGFDLMSLSNNHAWDLGECGVLSTIEAADRSGVVHAGTGRSAEEALEPAYIEARGTRFALVAGTTSRDERDLLSGTVNGVWTGHQDDWDRNLSAVREAAAHADFVIYYHHFQIDEGDFEGVGEGERNGDGHTYVEDIAAWQESFARAIIDAGASMYLGHGHRGFDGIEIYRGRPLIRQFGGLAYHAMRDIGGYPGQFAFWGLLGNLSVMDGSVIRMEFIPLTLNEGQDLVEQYDREEFLRRRGMPEVATGAVADSILMRFKELSKRYGTDVDIANGRALLELRAGG
jgi:poly-gamma-glutamate capsule biosynthesis protein CapA/YwtB (metallophosphatase superfamily)